MAGRVRHERLRDCTARSLTDIGHVFELGVRAAIRVLEQIQDPTSDIHEQLAAGDAAGSERKALAALFLCCIMRSFRPLLEH